MPKCRSASSIASRFAGGHGSMSDDLLREDTNKRIMAQDVIPHGGAAGVDCRVSHSRARAL